MTPQGFRDGSESGAQLCVYHRGEKVIDVFGISEPNTDGAASDYDEDTLQIVYSSSKAGFLDVSVITITTTTYWCPCLHKLAQI